MEKTENTLVTYRIAIIDLFDAYYLTTDFDEWRYAWIGTNYPFFGLEGCVKIADRLFKALNGEYMTQAECFKYDSGYDVRIYDSNWNCVYMAHSKLPE